MIWKKKGLIFCPTGELPWARSHAHLPTPDVIEEEGIIRVYFASWDEDNVGRIGYVDLDIDDPGRVLYQTPDPILDTGSPEAFDSCGLPQALSAKTARTG